MPVGFFLAPGNQETAAAIGVGTGDDGVGAHPVVLGRFPLFSRQERQDGRQGIHGEAHPRAKLDEIIIGHGEVIADMMPAYHWFAGITGNDFHLQVIEFIFVFQD